MSLLYLSRPRKVADRQFHREGRSAFSPSDDLSTDTARNEAMWSR